MHLACIGSLSFNVALCAWPGLDAGGIGCSSGSGLAFCNKLEEMKVLGERAEKRSGMVSHEKHWV